MELLITIAYIFLIRLIFFDYKLLKYTLLWKFITIGLWISAALTEVIFLGQYAPYSKTMFVQSYVVQIAPEFGGLVKEVYVTPNKPVKKGEPLFQMDPTQWQHKVDVLEAQLAAAGTNVAELNQQVAEAKAVVKRVKASLSITKIKYAQFTAAENRNAISKLQLEQVEKNLLVQQAELEKAQAALQAAKVALESEVGDKHTAVAEVLGELAQVKYNLEHTTVRAPSDGYVSNLQLYPGAFVRLKQPVMAFINSEQHWLVATVPQRGIQHLNMGDKAEVAFDMYPGKIFDAEVENVIWAAGDAQGVPSGQLPRVGKMKGSQLFTVKLRIKNEDPETPLRFGASGLVALYSSDAADFLVILRQIELQSESFLNYLYNPFK
ncbi:MAG: HlyD family secretion protein [Gammaproteobacteria bacterium]|nr:HlyD family secretion protein [Gammaproteobacteria bacterium]